MNKSVFIISAFIFLVVGCSDRKRSPSMQSFTPASIIIGTAKKHKLDFSETGSGEGWNSGHGGKEWHYYSSSKVDNLETVIRDIYDESQTELSKLGAKIHGYSEDQHSFIVYGVTYTHGSREGELRIIAATLEEGTSIDIFLDEHPK